MPLNTNNFRSVLKRKLWHKAQGIWGLFWNNLSDIFYAKNGKNVWFYGLGKSFKDKQFNQM